MNRRIVGVGPGRAVLASARLIRVIALGGLLLLVASTTARADSIVVDGGEMTIGNGEVALQLFAPGVAVNTSYLTSAAPLLEQWFIGACSPSCAPGSPISLLSTYMFVGYGSITADGTVYDPVRAQIQLVFDPAVTMVTPAFSTTPVHMTAPFTLVDGLFGSSIGAFFNPGVTPAYDAGLLGGGRVNFDLLPTSGGAFTLGPSIVFDFGNPSPTPEPASIFLLGTALAGIAARKRLTS